MPGLCQARTIERNHVAVQLSQLVPLPEYREQRQRFFPSPASLDWYLRKHKPQLISAGALLMQAGRWFVDPETFDACVVEAAMQAAQRQT
jgi:hypothetical protein